MEIKKQNYIPLLFEVIIIQAENGYALSDIDVSNEIFEVDMEIPWD